MLPALQLNMIKALLTAILTITSAAGSPTRTYTVQTGDTATAIAARFDTTVETIVTANRLGHPDRIYAGQVLTIPVARPGASSPGVVGANPVATPVAPAERSARSRSDSILGQARLLTYYGNPLSNRMGILGELSKEELVPRLRRLADEYERAGSGPIKPALHLVATVAQDRPGPDGRWRARMPEAMIQEYVDLAAAHDMLVIVDIQIGHSDWPSEIEAMRRFLSKPHVHLAMDPEFDMSPGERPGDDLGHTPARDINHAIRYLAGLTSELNLPPKILIIHQFRHEMLPDKNRIEDDPRVDIAITMDGFGHKNDKIAVYNKLVRDQMVEYAGIKLFYRQDIGVMTPKQILELAPSPRVIIYQ